ncbi:xanthine phosphoribosyltransferase [Aerococcus urinae]
MANLKQRILEDGKVFPNNVLKVDSFLNHQIDPNVISDIADKIIAHYQGREITKIVTVEASGIAPSIIIAEKLGVPMVFAKKQQPSTLKDQAVYGSKVHSYTKDTDSFVIISKQYLSPDDKVLIIDDFLANGEAAMGLIDIVNQAQAEVVGVGICIEKSFQDGRQRIIDAGVDLYSEVRIASLGNSKVEFAEGH